MEKLGVRRSSEEHNFLGFKCNNKDVIETNIKGGFGVASDWPQLNKLAGKLRVSLTFENLEVEELMDAAMACIMRFYFMKMEMLFAMVQTKRQERS